MSKWLQPSFASVDGDLLSSAEMNSSADASFYPVKNSLKLVCSYDVYQFDLRLLTSRGVSWLVSWPISELAYVLVHCRPVMRASWPIWEFDHKQLYFWVSQPITLVIRVVGGWPVGESRCKRVDLLRISLWVSELLRWWKIVTSVHLLSHWCHVIFVKSIVIHAQVSRVGFAFRWSVIVNVPLMLRFSRDTSGTRKSTFIFFEGHHNGIKNTRDNAQAQN